MGNAKTSSVQSFLQFRFGTPVGLPPVLVGYTPDLIVEGSTGSGKTFIACALAHQACRQKRPVLYRRVSELVSALARARDRGTHERLMRRLARVSLLVLDDWGLESFSAEGR